MPPVDTPWQGFHFYKLCFSFFNFSLFYFPCLYSPVSILFLLSFILSSHSIPSFLSFFLSFCMAVCIRPSVGAGLAEQQSLRTHTRSLDTYCIQLSLHTQSIATHAQENNTHTHTIPCWQISHQPLPRQSELHFTVCVWQICTVYSQLFLPGLITEWLSESLFADPPPLRKHKEKMISFQLDRAQGNFPAVFTHSVRLSLVHMWGAEELSFGSIFCHGCTWVVPLFSISFLFSQWCSSSENCNSSEKRGNDCLDEATCLDAIVVEAMMNWFIRWHRKLLFKWMKYNKTWRHDCDEKWKQQEKKYLIKSITSNKVLPSYKFIFN